MSIVLNDLYDYDLKIYQDEKKFKFSLDSLLLSEFLDIKKSDNNILDLCTGNAPLPLIIAKNYNVNIIGIELQKDVYDLGIKSLKINNLSDKVKLINDDIKNAINYFPGNNFDIITCNPPYFKITNKFMKANKNLSMARHELTITFDEITEIVSKLLKDNGKFYFVHRPDRLEELIDLCHKRNLIIKKIIFISKSINSDINLILVKCVKNGNIGVKLYYHIINRDIKTYKQIFADMK